MGQVSPPADSSLPTLALPRMDRSHRQQTPISPRSPSPAWTSLIASRLPSPHARPPPHGQVSPPADSSLPRMDRSHRRQTPQQKIRSLATSDFRFIEPRCAFLLLKSYSFFILSISFLNISSCIEQKIPCLVDHFRGSIFLDSCIHPIISEDTFFKSIPQPSVIFWV